MKKKEPIKVAEVSLVYKTKVKATERACITCSKDVHFLMKQMIGKDIINHHEEVWMILLNTRNRVVAVMQVSVGGIDSTVVDVRIILQACLKTNVSNLILSHNHPGGGTKPSPQDDMITEKLFFAAKTMDIKLLDHIIITDESFYSYADEGRIEGYKNRL